MNLILGTIMTNQDNFTRVAANDLSMTDGKLVLLALENDRYYEMLVERYEKKLQHYILRFIHCSVQDAEDIIQDVFINAYRNLNDFDTNLKFSSWLYRIAHNEAVSYLRRVTARPRVIMEEEKFGALASELNVEKEVERSIDDSKLRDAIDQLNQKYREVIVLRYLEEKSYEEISDILQKPSGSVSSLITRAKRILREEIERKKII